MARFTSLIEPRFHSAAKHSDLHLNVLERPLASMDWAGLVWLSDPWFELRTALSYSSHQHLSSRLAVHEREQEKNYEYDYDCEDLKRVMPFLAFLTSYFYLSTYSHVYVPRRLAWRGAAIHACCTMESLHSAFRLDLPLIPSFCPPTPIIRGGKPMK